MFQSLREQILNISNQRVDLLGRVEWRRLHIVLVPIGSAVSFEDLVVFLEDFPEAREIESLIVLEKNERQVEFTERQFEIVLFAVLFLFHLALAVLLHDTLRERLGARVGIAQDVGERRKLLTQTSSARLVVIVLVISSAAKLLAQLGELLLFLVIFDQLGHEGLATLRLLGLFPVAFATLC